MAFKMEIFAQLRELADLEFFNICLRTLLVLQGTFQTLAYALRLSCASIKALLKAFILLRLWCEA